MHQITKTDGNLHACEQCGKKRTEHGYLVREQAEACTRFRPTPVKFDYHPPEGQRPGPALATTVQVSVINARDDVIEIHTYHEAEMRQVGGDERTKMSMMQLVMPVRHDETDNWVDFDGDRAYLRRYLMFAPAGLYIQGGSRMGVSGFAWGTTSEHPEDGGMSSYDSLGPASNTLVRVERWQQYVPHPS